MGKHDKLNKGWWIYNTDIPADSHIHTIYRDIEDAPLNLLQKQFLHARMQFFNIMVVKRKHGSRKVIKNKLIYLNDKYRNLDISEDHVRVILQGLQNAHYISDLVSRVEVVPGKKHPRTIYDFKINTKFLHRQAEMNRSDFNDLE